MEGEHNHQILATGTEYCVDSILDNYLPTTACVRYTWNVGIQMLSVSGLPVTRYGGEWKYQF
jgi:hypothetical protein